MSPYYLIIRGHFFGYDQSDNFPEPGKAILVVLK
ncbi:MAG: hypothetical protein JWQ63_1263 [Mucilaginibacter sp.]|nr:hypothetical protein [Mucilaginibacter sp.]